MSAAKNIDPVVISMGDPAGIGPEVVHRALASTDVLRRRDILVVGEVVSFAKSLGDNSYMQAYHIIPYEDFVSAPKQILEDFKSAGHGRHKPYFLDLGGGDDIAFDMGEGSEDSGAVALASFMAAVEVLGAGLSTTLVTAPMSKYWVQQAGFEFPGHTEALAEYFDGDPVMMLIGHGLKVALVTIHLPLARVPAEITPQRVERTIKAVAASLRKDFSTITPKIAVCGLNPHAGEQGRFGTEEEEILEPVIKKVSSKGINASGPYPADTVFGRALRGDFDAVIAMYHDQGLAPVKLISFGAAVNFSANLSIVRTSPDHGTAYDIAGKGKADAGSMLAAIELADAVSRRRMGEKVAPSIAERPFAMSPPEAQNTSSRPSSRSSRRRRAVTPES